MLESREKERILREAGYKYHFERSIYINIDSWKIFSIEAIDDHPVDWLKARIDEPNPTHEWKFYFNTPPTAASASSILGGFK